MSFEYSVDLLAIVNSYLHGQHYSCVKFKLILTFDFFLEISLIIVYAFFPSMTFKNNILRTSKKYMSCYLKIRYNLVYTG